MPNCAVLHAYLSSAMTPAIKQVIAGTDVLSLMLLFLYVQTNT